MSKLNSKFSRILNYTSDTLITYCPSYIDKNRISGHLFEILDYFLLLKENGIQCKILLLEDIDLDMLLEAYRDKLKPEFFIKYFSNEVLSKNIIINNFAALLKKSSKNKQSSVKLNIIAKNIIVTGGLQNKNRINFIAKEKVIYLRCDPNHKYYLSKKEYLLYDMRVYNEKRFPVPELTFNDQKDNLHTRHYIKKFFFDAYRESVSIISSSHKTYAIYLNSTLKKVSINSLKDIQKKYYPNHILFISGDSTLIKDPEFNDLVKEGSLVKGPVFNLIEKVDGFIYTGTTRDFDCSPRLITEMKFYNKEILFEIDEKYGDRDPGFYFRYIDTLLDIEKLRLKDNDLVLRLIQNKE